MSMPKGFKSAHGYATTKEYDGGADYRTIANQMTNRGYKMNHATARNEFLRGMKKIVVALAAEYGLSLTEKEISKIARDPQFQSGACELIQNM